VLVEDKSTKCPKCNNALTLKSYQKIWTKQREVHQFSFTCNSCNREYLFKDDVIIEKMQSRDSVAESAAIRQGEIEAALARRCLECGGPLKTGTRPYSLRCEWCHQEYSLTEGGDLRPRTLDQSMPKPVMREFYAVHR
jgi:Zn finger protein HypA/HybF involved in hydrogenase expression